MRLEVSKVENNILVSIRQKNRTEALEYLNHVVKLYDEEKNLIIASSVLLIIDSICISSEF